MRPLTYLLPFVLAQSTPSFAVDSPRVDIVRADNGRVRVNLAADPTTPPPRFRGTVYAPGVAEIFRDAASRNSAGRGLSNGRCSD